MQIYLSINLFGRRLLPWNEKFSDTNMLVNKDRLFLDGCEFLVLPPFTPASVDEIYKFVPRQYLTIMHCLEKQQDEKARPDYTYIG